MVSAYLFHSITLHTCQAGNTILKRFGAATIFFVVNGASGDYQGDSKPTPVVTIMSFCAVMEATLPSPLELKAADGLLEALISLSYDWSLYSKMSTKVTMTTNNRTTTHNIDMHGIAGAAFWCTLVGMIIYIVGYATPSWYTDGGQHIGVWEGCTCGSRTGGDCEYCVVMGQCFI